MNSFRAYIKKEFTEGVRTHKFLILAAGVLFFAVLDPVMLKLMPIILKSQLGNIDFGAMIELSQKTAMTNFGGDIYQISTFIMVLTLMGLVAGERNDKTLTIPVSMGCSLKGMLLGKLAVYGGYLAILSVTGMTVAYFYSGMIFGFDYSDYAAILRSGLLYGVFFTFVLSLLMLVSSMVKKPFVAGILTLLTVYLIPLLRMFKWLEKYLPSYLLTEADSFRTAFSGDLAVSLICTAAAVAIMCIFSIVKLENTEFV